MPVADIFCALVLTALLVVFRKNIKEVMEDISNHLGGPPNPMAPLPSTDAHLLLKRAPKKSADL
jgi:hypothetical protein